MPGTSIPGWRSRWSTWGQRCRHTWSRAPAVRWDVRRETFTFGLCHTHLERTGELCFIPQQEKVEMKRELWRIEDVMAGLSTSKANYKITIDSVQNPGGKMLLTRGDRPNNQTQAQFCIQWVTSVWILSPRKKISAFGVRPSSAFSQHGGSAASSQLHHLHPLPHSASQHCAKVGECRLLETPAERVWLQVWSKYVDVTVQ